jgi:hypothetical protein
LILGAATGATVLLALVGVGCGGDDTAVVPTDAQADRSVDATNDASADHSVASDAHPDVVPTDAKLGSDGESDADAAPQDADAAPAVDAPTLADFPTAVNTAYCMRLEVCCDGTDASAFQLGGCVSVNAAGGGYLNVSLANADGGHISYDPTNAANCLGELGNINCGTVDAGSIQQYISSCGQAMVGTLGVGSSGCTSAWDCAPPSYCDNFLADGGTVDGGKGTCKALAPIGSPCQDITLSTDCSENGLGHPSNYCAPNDGGLGGLCEPAFANGTPCFEDTQCQTQICEVTTNECLGTLVFSDSDLGDASSICSYYNSSPDAGGP